MVDNKYSVQTLSKLGICDITPCNDNALSNNSKALALSPMQASQISAFVSHIPELASAGALSNAYTVTFPEGLSGTLMKYKNGGQGTPIIGENGKIIGHASLDEVSHGATAMMSAFSIMAIASSQYYLTEIHNELKMLNQKIDTIMNFLYGDKRAELMSELYFVQHTYKNFSSIIEHNEQCIATISSLQTAQKTAMKDIEFYLSDLNKHASTSPKNYSDFQSLTDKCFKVKDSLELSMQLYAMACVMEVFYAQNYDRDYIADLKENIIYYINKCDKQILSDFSKLYASNDSFKGNKINKINTLPLEQKLQLVVDSLNVGDDAILSKTVSTTLDSIFVKSTFVVQKDGNVYKIA